jgi:PAS domain S-box-containing protein
MQADKEATVTGKFLTSRLSLSLYSVWPLIAVVLLIVQLAMWFMLRQGIALEAYCSIVYLALQTLACGLCVLNAVQSRQIVRLFWSFLAVADLFWVFSECLWFYYHVLRGRILPPFVFAAYTLFLHTVFQIAAVATRPHLKLATDRPYRALLSFLTLLFFWVFIYAYLVYAREFPRELDARTIVLGFQIPYFAQNLFLLVLLGRLVFSSLPPWKSIYGYLFLGSIVYVAGSLLFNLSYSHGSRRSNLSLILPTFTASICCFVWVALQGRKMERQLERTVQISNTGFRRVSILAMLAVLAIPFVGLFELFRGKEPDLTRVRLAIVLISMLLLGLVTFIRYILANRELTSDTVRANKQLRLAVEAGRMYAYEWDVRTGVFTRSPECGKILDWLEQPTTDTYEQMLSRVHPEDRQLLVNTGATLRPANATYQISYRMPRPDTSVVWVEETGHALFDAKGKILRIVGMVADITVRKVAESALRESEERFRVMADTTPSLIWMCDEEGKITYLNDQRVSFTGSGPGAGYGENWTAYVHPDDLKNVQDALAWSLKSRQRFSKEYRLRRHDGAYRWMFDVASPRVNGDGSFAGLIGSAIDITDQKLAQEALQTVGGRLLEAQDEERKRIARELHDDISQKLALLSMEVAKANLNVNGSPEVTKANLNDIRQHCSEIAKDIQSLSHQLHYSKLDYLGLAGALKGFCREFAKQSDVTVEFMDENVPRNLPKNLSLCLFRVAQEALHNAVKYSGTKEYTVELRGAANEVRLVVADGGAGFDAEQMKPNPGLGLVSMQERVHMVQGRFNIESTPGEGTTIVASVPLITSTSSAGEDGSRATSMPGAA